MGQNIKIKIADREYQMVAKSQDDEELIRLAADSINKKIEGYVSKFPGKPMHDILSFVALNEGISSILSRKELETARKEIAELVRNTDSYLNNTENQPLVP